MSKFNFSSDNYREDDTDERERDAESRSDAEREEPRHCNKCQEGINEDTGLRCEYCDGLGNVPDEDD